MKINLPASAVEEAVGWIVSQSVGLKAALRLPDGARGSGNSPAVIERIERLEMGNALK